MSKAPEKDQRSPEERARDRRMLRTRCDALGWAMKGNNIALVRVEYHRRIKRGSGLLIAWRRALWVTFKSQNT